MKTILVEATKNKKCDYCDDFAAMKYKEEELSMYMCEWCFKHQDQARESINESV